jgi:DnaJ-class molecular chaperone
MSSNTSRTANTFGNDTDGKCAKCHGTGEVHWGAVVNGQPTHSGECFQCRGKGYTKDSDQARTGAYWVHRMREDFSS